MLVEGPAKKFSFAKCLTVNILGFAGHTVSITSIQSPSPGLDNSHGQRVTEGAWQTEDLKRHGLCEIGEESQKGRLVRAQEAI